LDSLEDCTEAVRYEAAKAFCQAAGTPCQLCNRSGCCSKEVIKKLEDMAYGEDKDGCYKESSARVRAAARGRAARLPDGDSARTGAARGEEEVPVESAPESEKDMPAAPPVDDDPSKKKKPLRIPPVTLPRRRRKAGRRYWPGPPAPRSSPR